MSWNLCRDFAFSEERRTITSRMTEKSENIGEYVTMPQLMQILGGADQPGVKEMGTNYGTRCEQYGPPMISWNSWLQTDMYLYIKALLTS